MGAFFGKPIRQYVATVCGQMTTLSPKKIHAVTPRGFKLEIACFLLACSV